MWATDCGENAGRFDLRNPCGLVFDHQGVCMCVGVYVCVCARALQADTSTRQGRTCWLVANMESGEGGELQVRGVARTHCPPSCAAVKTQPFQALSNQPYHQEFLELLKTTG